jgi:hypothetical protein
LKKHDIQSKEGGQISSTTVAFHLSKNHKTRGKRPRKKHQDDGIRRYHAILYGLCQTNETNDEMTGMHAMGVPTGSARLLNSSTMLQSDPRPRDLRVAFVGDSITRYQYMSLSYYLRFGRWLRNDVKPNILQEKHFGDWNEYFNYSKFALAPNEQCDCYREDGAPIRFKRTYENRYFSDPERNNYVTFLFK